MPEISRFFGIRIMMYWDDHYPKHFHAEYADFSILVDIENATVAKGFFPSKQLKLTLAWCEIHKEELLKNWESAQQNGPILPIEPLC